MGYRHPTEKADSLQVLKTRHRMNNAAIARALGCTESTIGDWFRRDKMPVRRANQARDYATLMDERNANPLPFQAKRAEPERADVVTDPSPAMCAPPTADASEEAVPFKHERTPQYQFFIVKAGGGALEATAVSGALARAMLQLEGAMKS